MSESDVITGLRLGRPGKGGVEPDEATLFWPRRSRRARPCLGRLRLEPELELLLEPSQRGPLYAPFLLAHHLLLWKKGMAMLASSREAAMFHRWPKNLNSKLLCFWLVHTNLLAVGVGPCPCALLITCSANWWLVLISSERKVPLSGWWLVMICFC
jgi:hypothetical protein